MNCKASMRYARGAAILICLSLCAGIMPVAGQDSSATARKLRAVAQAVLHEATFQFVDQVSGDRFAAPELAPAEAQLHLESTFNDWRYWNGVLNIAMLKLSEALADPAYEAFVQQNLAFNFDHYLYFKQKHKAEDKWNYPFGQLFIMEELDDCGAMGGSLIEVQRSAPQDRYGAYITRAAEHILGRQGRLADGTLVRSFPHKWTLWADDLYMSIAFLARMGEWTNDRRYFDDAARQVINFHKYLFDEQNGLMRHDWYSDVKRPGVAFWGRANGWAILAQIDLLERLPQDHPQRSTLLALFQRHILGIAQYQGSDGLWHQLLDKVDAFLETSCSAMFTYGLARAINKGLLEPRYASIAQRGWEGIMSKIRDDGQVEGVCTGTGVSDDLAFYYRRPTPLNDAHGIGAVLLAGAEMLRLSKQ